MTLELWNFKYRWTYIRCIILFLRDTCSFYTVWKLLQGRKALFCQARVFVFWYIPFHSINLDFKKCNDLLNMQILFLICPSPPTTHTHTEHTYLGRILGRRLGTRELLPAEGSLGRSEVSPQPPSSPPWVSHCAPPCLTRHPQPPPFKGGLSSKKQVWRKELESATFPASSPCALSHWPFLRGLGFME